MTPQTLPLGKFDTRFQEIQRERVSERVAQELLRLIAGGELAPGERLPGERQLAEMMNVSRVSIRAALQQLKAQGFVSAVQGGGTRITAAAEEIDAGLSALIRANQENLRDLMELRAYLEVWAARRAASRASPRQRDEIDQRLAAMADPNRSKRHKAEDDLNFHLAIAKASGSAVYLHLTSVLRDILEEMVIHHRYTLYATEEDDKRFLEQHRHIAEAIRVGDAEGAAEAMAEHMANVNAKYQRDGSEGPALSEGPPLTPVDRG